MYYHADPERGFFLEKKQYQNEFGWFVMDGSVNTLNVADSSSMTVVFNYGSHNWPAEATSGRRGNRTYTFEKCCLVLGPGTYQISKLLVTQQNILPGLNNQHIPNAGAISELVICQCDDMTFTLKVRNVWDEVIDTLTSSNGVVHLPFQNSIYKDKSNFPLMISIEGKSDADGPQYRLHRDILVKAP